MLVFVDTDINEECWCWCALLEPRVFRKQPLYLHNVRVKLCTTTLSKPLLWDYIEYVVVNWYYIQYILQNDLKHASYVFNFFSVINYPFQQFPFVLTLVSNLNFFFCCRLVLTISLLEVHLRMLSFGRVGVWVLKGPWGSLRISWTRMVIFFVGCSICETILVGMCFLM